MIQRVAILSSLLACCMVTVAAGCAAPGDDAPDADAVSRMEKKELLGIARAELDRLDVPAEGRRVTVTADGNTAVVTFHLPEGRRGGDFIVTIDRDTKKVVDTKIWR